LVFSLVWRLGKNAKPKRYTTNNKSADGGNGKLAQQLRKRITMN